MYPLFKAFADLRVAAEPVPYADEASDKICARLLQLDGVLVWVDPITDGRTRSRLDPMLQTLADRGVWVSAHPDVIQKIGTKEVLFRTRHLGWGVDTYRYATTQELREQLPSRLRSNGPRVLKQRRGNGGIGTWKVQLVPGQLGEGSDPLVRIKEARRGSSLEEMRLSDFIRRCGDHFVEYECLIDQPLQSRTDDGMIRCYLTQNQVIGFSTQMPNAGDFAMARDKTMYESSAPRFTALKTRMESEWVPALQQLFGISSESLPAIWDYDFLYGPKDERQQDTYVLGEINVSAVFPFPESAVERIAQTALARMLDARKAPARRTSS